MSYDACVVNRWAPRIAFSTLTQFISSSNPFGICRSIKSPSKFFTISSYKKSGYTLLAPQESA
jgi:hypothetical protein